MNGKNYGILISNKMRRDFLTSVYLRKILFLQDTNTEYDFFVAKARDLFLKKSSDYGTSWRILRPSSLTDQIYIKACRIRSLEDKKEMQVDEPVDLEYIGIINYGIMALIQMALPPGEDMQMDPGRVKELYEQQIRATRDLMNRKNHDYGEAWRDMRISSMTDLILMKILRIKQIEENDSKTLISEGIDSNYMDIINYAIFSLIKLKAHRQSFEKN